MASHLLINERPLQVLPRLAVLIGLNQALALQQVHYWLATKAEHEDQRTLRDGHLWVFNSYARWQEQFPFWSVDTIQRLFRELEKEFQPAGRDRRPARGALVIAANFNARGFDHTKWVRIDYEEVRRLDGLLACAPPQLAVIASASCGHPDRNLRSSSPQSAVTNTIDSHRDFHREEGERARIESQPLPNRTHLPLREITQVQPPEDPTPPPVESLSAEWHAFNAATRPDPLAESFAEEPRTKKGTPLSKLILKFLNRAGFVGEDRFNLRELRAAYPDWSADDFGAACQRGHDWAEEHGKSRSWPILRRACADLAAEQAWAAPTPIPPTPPPAPPPSRPAAPDPPPLTCWERDKLKRAEQEVYAARAREQAAARLREQVTAGGASA